MSETFPTPTQIEDRADLGTGEDAVWDYWMGQERVQERESKRWMERGRRIVRRYRDERGGSESQGGRVHRFNILWSNVETLRPTLYARTPKPEVMRRWLDQDDTGRLAGQLLERAITYSLDPAGGSPFDAMMTAVVQDRLLPGRGVGRVLYVPEYGEELEGDVDADEYAEADAPAAAVAGEGDEPLREVIDEKVTVHYVFWEDYAEGPARQWSEVPWLRYRSYLTRDELVKRFGKKKGAKINLDFPKITSRDQQLRKDDPPPDLFKKAAIHEYWDRTRNEVVWIAPGTPGMVLDKQDDPLGLPDFFPSADPLLATITTDKRIPVPDYVEYQDQADELDKLTARIDRLTRALKVSGVYAGANKQVLQQLVDEGTENRMIPVEDWLSFSDKGGLDKMIMWMPIDMIAAVLMKLYDARDRVKQVLYEITGIGDILRGETVPNETATAQQLKSNFATRRIVPQQKAVQRFARDTVRLMGAIIAGHFSAETISRITGYPQLLPVPQLPPAPPMFLPDPRAMAPAPANDQGPPPHLLPQQEGGVVHFANGQQWARRGGQHVRMA